MSNECVCTKNALSKFQEILLARASEWERRANESPRPQKRQEYRKSAYALREVAFSTGMARDAL